MAPVSQLPGVVDAGTYHPSHKKTQPAGKANAPSPAMSPAQSKVFQVIDSLNHVPENQLTDKAGSSALLLEELRTADGPEYLVVRSLLARADVRKALSPSVKALLAGVVSSRWDCFNLAGNLWLAALQSSNGELQARARQRLIGFIQPAHIPILIHLLQTPGPNVPAYEILQEVTGQTLDPNPKTWRSWWNKSHGKVDVVNQVLTRSQAQVLPPHAFDQAMFWYLPEGLSRADKPYEKHSTSDKNTIGRWRDWANMDVKRFVEDWESAKPMFERIVHQPDPRVSNYLTSLLADPGTGDYAAVVLAWRGETSALGILQDAYIKSPSVGRALARGSIGDKTALEDLLKMMEAHRAPLSFPMMDETMRGYAAKLPGLGVISAEQAFELLAHQRFGLAGAVTAGEKRKALKKARAWLDHSLLALTLDKKRGYYVLP